MAPRLLSIALSLSLPALTTAAAPTLRAGPEMQQARAAHQVTPLGPGRWLLSGGCSGNGCSPVERSAELFDARRSRFEATGAMAEARVGHLALPLAAGQVLVAGGWNGSRTTASAERFDAASGRFQTLQPMQQARMDASASRLADGRILVVGGASATNQPLSGAELFDPRDGRWSATGPLQQARAHHASAVLDDGRVLVSGGLRGRRAALASAEIYEPRSGRFEPLLALAQPRCKHAALRLPDGRVMLIGGSRDCDDRQRLRETEIFDPATGRFTAGPSLLQARYKIVDAVSLLPDGAVLVAGDAEQPEWWRPGWAGFRPYPGRLPQALAFSQLTPLGEGRLLLSGGYDGAIQPQSGTWLFQER